MTESTPSFIADYQVVRLLGHGGMATVYEVLSSDGRRGALKLFTLDHGEIDFLRKRFRSEYAVLRRLSHPRLVTVWDAGEDLATGRPYFVMNLVENHLGRRQTLEDVRREGAFTEADAQRWYFDLVEALNCCHRAGIVHRDVKLENVLLGPDGHVVLSDFGIARICDSALRQEMNVTTTFVEGETTRTRPVMGTYWYLAPELRAGHAATAASDAYALGVLFFRLLTGMWYEPGTKALDLLSVYEAAWRKRLASLLSNEPASRQLVLIESRPQRYGWWILFVVAGLILIFWIACFLLGWCEGIREDEARVLATSNATEVTSPPNATLDLLPPSQTLDAKTLTEVVTRVNQETRENYLQAMNELSNSVDRVEAARQDAINSVLKMRAPHLPNNRAR